MWFQIIVAKRMRYSYVTALILYIMISWNYTQMFLEKVENIAVAPNLTLVLKSKPFENNKHWQRPGYISEKEKSKFSRRWRIRVNIDGKKWGSMSCSSKNKKMMSLMLDFLQTWLLTLRHGSPPAETKLVFCKTLTTSVSLSLFLCKGIYRNGLLRHNIQREIFSNWV